MGVIKAGRRLLKVAVALAGLVAAATVWAQEEIKGGPEFSFAERTEVDKSKWTGSVGAGLIINSGNSNVTAFSGNAAANVTTATQLIAVEATGAYARSQLLSAQDINGDGKLQHTEIISQPTVSVKNWLAKGRYDRFIGTEWSAYTSVTGSSDPIAGKDLTGSAQLGASYKVLDAGRHKVTAEAGYDFSYERYVSPAGSSLQIHSLRGYLGYRLTLADEIGISAGLEALTNMNSESTPTGTAAPLEDTRLIGKVQFDAKVYGNVTARFGFAARYDNVPAPRPKPATELPYDGFVLSADKLDTRTDVALIVNFQ